jgi:hypothetical protein
MPDFDFGDTSSGSVPASASVIGPRPRPIRPAQVEQVSQHGVAGPGWFFLFANSLACCLAGIVIGYAVAGVDWPDIKPSPVRDGTYVLFNLEYDEIKDLTTDQQQIVTSVLLREWADENCTIERMEDGTDAAAIRFLDKDDRLANESDTWRQLHKSVTLQPPSVLVAGRRGVKEFALPKNVKETIEALEKVSK